MGKNEARDVDDLEEENTREVMNISNNIIRFELDGARYKMGPKETRRIHKNYATRMLMREGRDPVPSTVELLTNKQVLPIDDPRVRSFLPLRAK
jgi:hypothetical protein